MFQMISTTQISFTHSYDARSEASKNLPIFRYVAQI